MAKVRSPNYPSMPLGAALEAIRAAYAAENRYKMSRSVLAGHLGYTSLNGRALGKIGAVRAYGLVEGAGDEMRVSEDAVHALEAPQGSKERVQALIRLASRPSLFQELQKDFPAGLPSLENLRFTLIKKGFTPDAAEKAAKNYLSTMSLVAGVPDSYNPPDEDDEEPEVEARAELQPPPGSYRRAPPPSGGLHAEEGILKRTAVFPLSEGEVSLTFPATLSDGSLKLLRSFLELTMQQMELAKAAGQILYPGAKVPGETGQTGETGHKA